MSTQHERPYIVNSSVREDWSVGSAVEIFSKYANQWKVGTITRIIIDYKGEWLEVVYDITANIKRSKLVRRWNMCSIRPLQFPRKQATNETITTTHAERRAWAPGSSLKGEWMTGTVMNVSGRNRDGHLSQAHRNQPTKHDPVDIGRWSTRPNMKRGALICAFWMRINLNISMQMPQEILNSVMKFWYIPRYPFTGNAWCAENTPTPERVRWLLTRARAMGTGSDNLTFYEIAVYNELMRWRSTGDRGSQYDDILDEHLSRSALRGVHTTTWK